MPENTAPYTKLLTYRYSYLVFHLNYQFTEKYLAGYKFRRLKEQMDSAARSGKQNIIEGASQGTSLKAYIKLVGVARGSLEELLEDYKDYATINKISVWNWNEERYKGYRRFRYFVPKELPTPPPPLPPIPKLPENRELTVNLLIELIYRTCFLLDQQRRSLEEKHKREGGFTEKLYRERVNYRNSNHFL